MDKEEGKGIIKIEGLKEVKIPDTKPPEKSPQESINTLAINTQTEQTEKRPYNNLERVRVSDIRHIKVWNYIVDNDVKPTDAYIKVYKFKGKREQARKNAHAIIKVIRRDLAKKEKDGLFLYARENFLKILNTEGVTLQKVAKKLNFLLDAPKNSAFNEYAIIEALKQLNLIFGSYAPTKQEVVHITPATSKDVAAELFQMFENSGYLRFIEQSVKVYRQGGKPEDVVIDTEYSVEEPEPSTKEGI